MRNLTKVNRETCISVVLSTCTYHMKMFASKEKLLRASEKNRSDVKLGLSCEPAGFNESLESPVSDKIHRRVYQ